MSTEQESQGLGTTWVLAIGFGLLLILGLGAGTMRRPAAKFDGLSWLSENFGTTGLPWGLESVESHQLRKGEQIVRLLRPSSEESAVMADGTRPQEALFLNLPFDKVGFEASERQIKDLFKKQSSWGSWGGMSSGGRGGGDGGDWDSGDGDDEEDDGIEHEQVAMGELVWSSYRPNYVHVRSKPKEGPSVDTVRLNLSSYDRACALILSWPAGEVADLEMVEDVLAQLEPPAAPPSQTRP